MKAGDWAQAQNYLDRGGKTDPGSKEEGVD